MSQAGQNNSAMGPLPPTVPTSFVTDLGTAVPAANVLNVPGGSSVVNNDNGLMTTGSGNTLTVELTNRQTGTVTTTDATPTTIITFALGAAPGVFYFRGSLAAFDKTDVAGGAYDYTSGVRTTGAAGVELGTEFKDEFEELAMENSDFNVIVSGNNFVVQVIGLAGKTIDWNADLNFRFVG